MSQDSSNTNIRNKMYEIAKREIGTSEISGPAANKRIIEYHSATTLHATSDEVPWCSAFVNWLCRECGIPGTGSAMARSFLLWGRATDDPEIGDVVVFSRGSDGISGHVGLVVSRSRFTVSVLGGNQGDKVQIKNYPRFQVLGYRRYS